MFLREMNKIQLTAVLLNDVMLPLVAHVLLAGTAFQAFKLVKGLVKG